MRELSAKAGLPAVIVNPSAPVGPRDIKPTPTGRIIVECASGRMPAYVDTGLNLAHVDDVAEGHLLALRRGRVGERYILGGQNIRLGDMLTEIARQAGRRSAACAVADWSGLSFRRGERDVRPSSRARSRSPRATASRWRANTCSSTIRKPGELGYAPRAYEEGVSDAIAWFPGRRHLAARGGAAAAAITGYRPVNQIPLVWPTDTPLPSSRPSEARGIG